MYIAKRYTEMNVLPCAGVEGSRYLLPVARNGHVNVGMMHWERVVQVTATLILDVGGKEEKCKEQCV